MEREALTQLATQIAGKIKTESDLNDISRMLKKLTVETALNAELEAHLVRKTPTSTNRDGRQNPLTLCEMHDNPGDRSNHQRNVRCRCVSDPDIQSNRSRHRPSQGMAVKTFRWSVSDRLPGLVVKVRQDKPAINKSVYLALNLEGRKELYQIQ